MKFLSLLAFGALAAVASAQDSSSSSSSDTNTPTTVDTSIPEPTDSLIVQCIKGCNVDDVNCKAQCTNNPSPSDSQVNATTTCVAACDQGDGSEQSIQAYTVCRDNCINNNFFSPTDTPSTSTNQPDSQNGDDNNDNSSNDNSSNDNSSNDNSSNDNNSNDSSNNNNDSSSTGANRPSSTSGSDDSSETNAPPGEGAASAFKASSLALLGVIGVVAGVVI